MRFGPVPLAGAVGAGRVNSHAVDAGIAGLNARQINAEAKSKGAG